MCTAFRIFSVLCAFVCLTGCYKDFAFKEYAFRRPSDYKTKFPIVLKEQEEVAEIYVGNRASNLSSRDERTVLAFLDELLEAGVHEMVIYSPVGSKNALGARRIVGHIMKVLRKAEATVSIVHRTYRVRGSVVLAPIRLTYLRMGAVVRQKCNQWSEGVSSGFIELANEDYPGWGCVTQSNLAAIAVHPPDLVTQRGAASSSARRRQVIFEKYERGEQTTSAQQLHDAGGI